LCKLSFFSSAIRALMQVATLNQHYTAQHNSKRLYASDLRSVMPNVLIVDDHDPMRATVAQALRGAGAEVREASEGGEALALLRQQPADLVILDLMMPGMDGATLIEAIRADAALGSTRILVVTGQADGVAAARAAGADEVLMKPVTANAVIEATNAVLGS
jgi:CheY-like chemotaxis protein